MPLCVSTHVGDSLIVDRVYRSCIATVWQFDTQVDLIILYMEDIDMILGMD